MTDFSSITPKRDHGGGLDGAMAQYSGTRSDWIDLSTGINPLPYPVSGLMSH
ncbi:MAG: cobalamin biosynthetic protein CobC, partial [Paracoccaceae bacterium]